MASGESLAAEAAEELEELRNVLFGRSRPVPPRARHHPGQPTVVYFTDSNCLLFVIIEQASQLKLVPWHPVHRRSVRGLDRQYQN